ncbi:MAG: primosomal protein N' [Dehalococcoidia bacterium]
MPDPAPPRPKYVRVAVNSGRPTPLTFTYSVPSGREVEAGEIVHVPWGPRTLQGVVVEGPMDVGGYPAEQTRPIEPPIDGAPRIDAARLDLARWIHARYLAPAWESFALMLPPGAGERPRSAVVRGPNTDTEGLTARQREVHRLLTDEPQDLDELKEQVEGGRGVSAAVTVLFRRGLAERRYTLSRPRGRPRVVEMAALAIEPEAARARIEAIPGRRSSRRSRALRALIEAAGPLPEADVAKIARGAPAVQTLVRDGLLARDGDNVLLALPAAEAERAARAFARTLDETAMVAILERLLAASSRRARVPDLTRDIGRATREALTTLEAEGTIRLEEELDRRDPLRRLEIVRREPAELIPEQREAAEAIRDAIEAADGTAFLLQGVTGSGKTEVYLQALDDAVSRGKRGIVLVPEIALTPQTVRRFAERFPGRVGVLHSGLALGEAYDEWHRIAEGEYDVVVGSRSALFAPQPDLGLIVIDEAHEWTYKQHDPPPRYDARDAALRLAELTGAALVYGTATPDAERWYAAAEDNPEARIERLDLPRRVRVVPQPDGPPRPMPWAELPEVEIVDMRGARSLFSPQLVAALAETLDRDEQAILFLNRRGRAAFLLCPHGHSPACQVCDVTYTLHDPQVPAGIARRPRLVCHQCGRSRNVPTECPECGSRLRGTRAGTQEVEREVRFHFMTARVLRWDRDTARNAQQHEDNLRRFANHEADVLVGTQMVAKGLDLPLVTLVGVVLADYSLREGDFRSGERTVQLLEQVAGRAGRADRHGRVIVQTMQPEHPAVIAAANHDVDGYFQDELVRRSKYGYPPFRRLARLVVAHEHGDFAREEAARVMTELQRAAAGLPNVDVRGPTPPAVPRLRGRYRWQILVFAPDPAELLARIELPNAWSIDIDPLVVS